MKSCLCVGDVSVKWNKSSAWLTVHMELNWHLLFINMHISSPIFSDLLIVAYWRRMQHRSGKTLARVMACCTKPLPEPMLIHHQRFSLGLTWEYLHKKCLWTYVRRLHFKKPSNSWSCQLTARRKSLPQLLGTNELTFGPRTKCMNLQTAFWNAFFFNENDCISNFRQALIQGTVCLAPSHNSAELNTKDDLIHCFIVCVPRPQWIIHTHVYITRDEFCTHKTNHW